MQLSLVLAGGRVVDGTGAPALGADVGLQDGQIAAIGDLSAAEAAERLDVSGRVVAPGFIDMHSHSDLSLLVCPTGDSMIHQGVTTEVVGNCGFSPAPVADAAAAVREIHSFFGRWVKDLAWDWRTYGDYAERLAAGGLSLNVVPLVGHVTARTVVMGSAQRPPTTDELAGMQALVRSAMEDGCFGISTGLVYPPGAYADTEELVAVAKVAAEYGGLYFSHIRGESASLLRATSEAIEIGERARMGVQIAHHKAAFRPYWGRLRQAIALSEWATERGQDVSFDVYPYTAGSAPLTQIIPDWAHAGGKAAMIERLRAPATRAQLWREVDEQGREWDKTVLAWLPDGPGKEHEGQTLAQVAEQRGVSPIDALFDLLIASAAEAMMVLFVMDEADVQFAMRHPLAMIGSDGWVLSPSGPLGEGKPHPRSYGCYPRVLGKYVREYGLLTLEEAIHKASYRPAEKLGLKQKGRLQVGADADLVVFDPATITDEATYGDPHRLPTGVEHVLVAGHLTIRHGRHTGARAGRVLRRT